MGYLTDEELEIFLTLLLKIVYQEKTISIKRIAKSLFKMMTEKRFSTDSNLPIIR